MTIQGAIVELQNLLDADDVPFYYKGGIEKVIETIQMEIADRKTEPMTSGVVWYEDEFDVCDSRNGCVGCEYHICKLEQTEPQTEHGFSAKAMCSTKLFEAEPQTDCSWK